MRCAEMVWTPAAHWQSPEPLGDASGLVLHSGARGGLTKEGQPRELLAAGPPAVLNPAVRQRGRAARLVAGTATAAARAAADRTPAADLPALPTGGIGRLMLQQSVGEAIKASAGRLPPGTHRICCSSDGEDAPRPGSGTAGRRTETMLVSLLSEVT